jgi:hypothetical protein
MKMPSGKRYCNECGREISPRAEICPGCGVRQSYPGPNRVVAALLAIFLGSLGAHKFYLGRIGLGILYLLLCWTFLPGFIGLIEGFLYLTMTEDAFRSKYGG